MVWSEERHHPLHIPACYFYTLCHYCVNAFTMVFLFSLSVTGTIL